MKCEEDCAPLLPWILEDEGPILVDAVVLLVLAGAALIHVDVVNPVAWHELEVLVRPVRFRSPPVAERVDEASFFTQGTEHRVL